MGVLRRCFFRCFCRAISFGSGYPSFWDKNALTDTSFEIREVVEDSISRPEASAEASASAARGYPSFWDKKHATARASPRGRDRTSEAS